MCCCGRLLLRFAHRGRPSNTLPPLSAHRSRRRSLPSSPPPALLYLQDLVTQCHVYDEDVNYVPFDFAKEEAFFAAQRKFLPN